MVWSTGSTHSKPSRRRAAGVISHRHDETTPRGGGRELQRGPHVSRPWVFFFFFAVTAKCPDPRNSLAEPVTASHAALRLPGWEENQAEKKRKKKRKSESARRENMAGEEGSWERSERPAPARARAEWGEGRKVYFHVRAGYTLGTPRLGLASPARQGDGPTGVLCGAVGWVRFSVAFAPQQGGPAVSQLASRWGPPAPVSFFSF